MPGPLDRHCHVHEASPVTTEHRTGPSHPTTIDTLQTPPGAPLSSCSSRGARRSLVRLAIVNLFYPPDLAPSAHFAASLAEHRAGLGDKVTVICGKGSYLGGASTGLPQAGRSAEEEASSRMPRVIRLWTPALGRGSTLRRLGDYLAFLVSAVARVATLPRQDVIIPLTSPPYAIVVAVAHRLLHRRTRIVLWSHDVFPDAAEEYGTIKPRGVASRFLRAVKRWLFRRVDHVVALDRAMLDRELSQYASNGRPNESSCSIWATWGTAIQRTPSLKRRLDWRATMWHSCSWGVAFATPS